MTSGRPRPRPRPIAISNQDGAPQRAFAHQPAPPAVPPISYGPPVIYGPPPSVVYPQPPAGFPPMIPLSARFTFDGGAATYFGTAIAGFLVTVLTFGICLPWALCMRYRWRTKHTLVDGYRLRFTGIAIGLFGQWIKWWFLAVITLGIYSFWIVPRLTRWITIHQEFDPTKPRVIR